MPSIDQIEEAGYKICILPLVALCSAAMAIKKALEVMKIEGTSEGLLTDMMDFDTITSTLGLGDIIRVEKNYGRY